MKLNVGYLLWVFSFFNCIFFIGVSIGKHSIVLFFISHIFFAILLYFKKYIILYNPNIKYKKLNITNEINEEAFQKIKEIHDSYK